MTVSISHSYRKLENFVMQIFVLFFDLRQTNKKKRTLITSYFEYILQTIDFNSFFMLGTIIYIFFLYFFVMSIICS